MPELTNSDFDRLALDACETIGYQGGRVAAYDVAGYDRIMRRESPPAQVQYRELPSAQKGFLPKPAQFEDRPYLVRIGGFQRQNLYGPDEVGALFRQLGIAWNDGLGNGLYESLLIDRKYDLSHTLEAPIFDYSLPFLDEEYPAFIDGYNQHLDRLTARLKELEPVYGRRLLEQKSGVCMLHILQTPLTLFIHAYQQNPQRVTEELQRWIGRPVPPLDPTIPADRLALVKFWSAIRSRYGKAAERLADLLRARFGRGTEIVGNFHDLPVYDFDSFGRVFDYPAVAVRPLLLEDDLLLKHYTAYFTRLYRDLTERPPMVSVRINLSAAGSHFIPGPNLVRHWTDQAVRYGAGAFYLWPRDYPMDQSDPYDGPMLGNPEPNTRPQERWETSLQLHSELATRQRFVPPEPQVAILVPWNSAVLYREAWRRIYAAFSACTEARIYAGFIGDWQIARSGVPAHVRLMIVPVLEFLSPVVRSALERFTQRGGILLAAEGDLYDLEGRPVLPLQGARTIPAELFNVFPLKSGSSANLLQDCAGLLWQEVKQGQVDCHTWVGDLTLASLPPSTQVSLREPDGEIQFDHWLYEHSSKWIYPYLKK
jgi:hypothetical protein